MLQRVPPINTKISWERCWICFGRSTGKTEGFSSLHPIFNQTELDAWVRSYLGKWWKLMAIWVRILALHGDDGVARFERRSDLLPPLSRLICHDSGCKTTQTEHFDRTELLATREISRLYRKNIWNYVGKKLAGARTQLCTKKWGFSRSKTTILRKRNIMDTQLCNLANLCHFYEDAKEEA